MTTDTTAVPSPTADTEVMAAVDGDGADERLVIADVSRDDAWLSVHTTHAAGLACWR